MKPAPPTADEEERLASLASYQILDTLPEQAYDDLTKLAAEICEAPISLVSLVDSTRQWFKSAVGVDAKETPRDWAFCAHAIRDKELLEVPNALEDERFYDNPLVAGDPNIRFYAGAPLVNDEGHSLGTLCVIDRVPRKLTERQRELLLALGRRVVSELDLRRRIIRQAKDTEALRISEERYALAVRGTSEGLWDWDPATNEVYYAPRFKELLGFTDAEFPHVLDSWKDRLHPDDVEPTMERFRAHLEERAPFDVEYRLRLKSGEIRWFRARGEAIWDAAGRPLRMAGGITDIDEAKHAEVEREQLLTRLRAANQELKDFAYVVSHDLKAPLRAISSLANWLESDYQDQIDEEGRQQLKYLVNRANRMGKLIDGILAYSQAGRIEGESREVDLHELITDVIESLAPPAGVKVSIDTPLPIIKADPVRITQLFQNLISNAISHLGSEEGEIRITGRRAGGNWAFTVADTGPGIEPQHFDRIFKLFQTLQPPDEEGGTGIGLALVKRIAEAHAGSITVASPPGEGARFTFNLPLNYEL